MNKIVSAREAVSHIKNNSILAVGGFCGFGSPDELFLALRKRFDEDRQPQGLTLLKGVSIGDRNGRGANHLCTEGLVKKVICAHTGLEPDLMRMISESKVFAYTLPLGTITEILRATAAKRPGVLTYTGLGTFADPRLEGSKANSLTKESGEDIVDLLHINGKDCLFYKPIPIDACLIRGTYADEDGNISMEQEAIIAEQLEMAEATHNSGGIVIVQVLDVVKRGTLDPSKVKIHGFMVDYVVKAREENHRQGFDSDKYRPELTGAIQLPIDKLPTMELNARKICGRRVAMELKKSSIINLGIGMPDAVAAVASEEGFSADITLSIESGVLGGVPLGDLGLGAAVNPEAIYKMPDILNIYNGGGLDSTVLGFAEVDASGNVNSSKFGGRVTGPGGFIDIAQFTPNVYFVGTFTAGGLKLDIKNGELHIKEEGKSKKFRRSVEQITFAGSNVSKNGQNVMIVTERAVFQLMRDGLTLIEIAPGIDLEKDIFAQMEFIPKISAELRIMDKRIFCLEKMQLSV